MKSITSKSEYCLTPKHVMKELMDDIYSDYSYMFSHKHHFPWPQEITICN